MKNKIALFFIFSSFLLCAQSSVYKPFPEVYGDWVTIYDADECNCYTGFISFTSGDTIVDGKTYMKVYQRGVILKYGNYGGDAIGVTGSAVLYYLYRNDLQHKKVYIISLEGNHTESLWYDFDLNLKIGDSLKTNTASYDYNQYNSIQLVLSSVDSVLICNDYHKVYHFNKDAHPWGGIDLTEGIGYSTGLYQVSFGGMPPPPIVTYSSKDNCLDTASQYEKLTTGVSEVVQINTEVIIYPNPASQQITMQSQHANGLPFQYNVLNNLGQKIQFGWTKGSGDIDVSELPSGIYFLQLINEKKIYSQNKFIKE